MINKDSLLSSALLVCVLGALVQPAEAVNAAEYRAYAKKLNDAGKYSEALKYENAAIQTGPAQAESFELRAFSCFRLGQFANAASDYTSSLRLDPNNMNCYRLRGHCYFLTGKYSGIWRIQAA